LEGVVQRPLRGLTENVTLTALVAELHCETKLFTSMEPILWPDRIQGPPGTQKYRMNTPGFLRAGHGITARRDVVKCGGRRLRRRYNCGLMLPTPGWRVDRRYQGVIQQRDNSGHGGADADVP